MQTIGYLILLALLFIGCTTKNPTDNSTNKEVSPKELPNIILIYADDLGRGLLSGEGQKIIKTPNIDLLATEGICFENAYGCMLCAPARASLLTSYHDYHGDKWQNINRLYSNTIKY